MLRLRSCSRTGAISQLSADPQEHTTCEHPMPTFTQPHRDSHNAHIVCVCRYSSSPCIYLYTACIDHAYHAPTSHSEHLLKTFCQSSVMAAASVKINQEGYTGSDSPLSRTAQQKCSRGGGPRPCAGGVGRAALRPEARGGRGSPPPLSTPPMSHMRLPLRLSARPLPPFSLSPSPRLCSR